MWWLASGKEVSYVSYTERQMSTRKSEQETQHAHPFPLLTHTELLLHWQGEQNLQGDVGVCMCVLSSCQQAVQKQWSQTKITVKDLSKYSPVIIGAVSVSFQAVPDSVLFLLKEQQQVLWDQGLFSRKGKWRKQFHVWQKDGVSPS